MNKIFLIGFLLIILLGVGISAGVLTQKDFSFTYPTSKVGNELTLSEMIKFDGLTYEVKGNTIYLYKKGVLNYKKIFFNQTQSCLKWENTKCKDNQNNLSETCNVGKCLKQTNYTKEYFIENAIKRELERLKQTELILETKRNQSLTEYGLISIK